MIKLVFIIWLILYSCCVSANNEEFKKWLKQEKQSFQTYKEERDREFTEFLKKQWKAVELLKGVKRDNSPKPRNVPVASTPVPVISDSPVPVKPLQIAPVPAAPDHNIPPSPVVVEKRGKKIEVEFFGSSLTFYYDEKFDLKEKKQINEEVVSQFWSSLSLADFDSLIVQLDEHSKALSLGDWSYALLVHKVANTIYPDAKNNQVMFTWFIMSKKGYMSRIAYDLSNAYLLMQSQQQIYAVPFFTFDGTRYYVVSFDNERSKPGNVYTYDGNYPGTSKSLNMGYLGNVIGKSEELSRTLLFEFEGKKYSVIAKYRKERINYMSTYPQIDLAWYFKSDVDSYTAVPIKEQLYDYIRNMNEIQAANFLLRFVQTSLEYKTDDDQFGKENYLFPEETFRYPYSDCEDRSILYAWLVKTLLGLKVVALDYPGHVATAVKFSTDVPGDTINYKGDRYTVSDPTYINASVGMTMPDFRHVRPKILEINQADLR